MHRADNGQDSTEQRSLLFSVYGVAAARGRPEEEPEKELAQDGVEPESGEADVFHHDLLSLDDRTRVRAARRRVNAGQDESWFVPCWSGIKQASSRRTRKGERTMTRLALGALALALTVAVGTASAAGTAFPKQIDLPNGFQPEGISIAGERLFVGSIPTGAVYRGSLRTGMGSELVPAAGDRRAIGLEADRGRLFVAGGPTGKAFVYDARTGATLAELTLATGAGATFVNDVAVTKRAAWFTDSFRDVLYRVPLGPSGRPGSQSSVQTVPLGGDFVLQSGFNANGIDARPNGGALVIVQSNTGTLFRVDPRTGVATAISLGGASVPNGDGILLEGFTLYVVQNQLNQIAKIALRPGLRTGRIVKTITDSELDVPTTIDSHGSRLYAVNARFSTPPTPSTEYWVTRLPK